MNRLVLLGWMLVGVFLGALPLRSAPEAKEIPSLNEAFVLRIWDSERQTHYPSIQCIAQSTDGYLWAGSYSGLIRFDGRRFTRFDPQALDPRLGTSVSLLYTQAPHFLWVGTDRGLVRVGPAEIEVYRADQGVPARRTHSVLQIGGGQMLASVGDRILRLVGNSWEPEQLPPGHQGKEWTLVQDVAGDVYAWTRTAILRRQAMGWSVVMEAPENAALQGVDVGRKSGLWIADDFAVWHWDRDGVTARQPRPEGFRGDRVHLHEDASGLLWLGCYTQGLVVLGPEGARWKATSQDGLPNTSITSLKEDREGNLWVGSNGGGLLQVQQRSFRVYSSKEGLEQVVVNSMAGLGDGSILVGTHGGGAQVLRSGRFEPPIRLDGNSPRKWVHAVLSDGQGGAWVGTVGDGLFRWRDGRVVERIDPRAFGSENVDGLFLDSKGRLWIGGSGSTALMEAGRVRVLGAVDGLPARPLRTLGVQEAGDGTIWILLAEGGLFRWKAGTPGFEPVELPMRPPGFRPERIYADLRGAVWLGGLDPVIARYRDDRIRWITPGDGLPVTGVYSLMEDGLGGLWLGGPDAIGRVSLDSVGRLESGVGQRLESWRFGAADGVAIPDGREFPFPSVMKSRDGKLWFATLNGVAMTDPARVRAHRAYVAPILESIAGVDGNEETLWAEPVGVRKFPAGIRDLRVRYTSTLLGDPERVEFEYRVNRPGADWLPGPPDRLVLMTGLRAGEHSLAVRSRLVGAPDWGDPVTMQFEVGWFWWERPEVRWAWALAAFVVVALGMWWRLERRYRRQRTFLARELELKQLAQAKEGAEAANRAKTEFIAMISHELRTPLHGLLGHVELLRDASLTSTQTGYLQTVRNSGEALLRVINEVLDYSRLETGRMDLNPQAFVLRPQVSTTMELLMTNATARGLRFVCRVDPGVPEVVHADSHRIHQVLMNLTANAIKFTRAGHVWVTILPCVDRPGFTEFQVEDSGIGIATEDLPRLFQKFTQVDVSTTRRFGGTGLGLAICKGLVERMGGEIGCRSELGKGSTFWFRIPLPAGELSDGQERRVGLPWVLQEYALVGMDDMTAGAVSAWATAPTARGTRHGDLVSVENWLRQPGVGVDGGVTVFLDWSVVERDPRFAVRSLRNGARRTAVRLVALLGAVGTGVERDVWEWGFDYVWRQPYLAMPQPMHELVAGQMRAKAGVSELSGGEGRAARGGSRMGEGSTDREAGAGTTGRKRRVLLVEDHPVNQAYMREALLALGCVVEMANNGREAVELARRAEYDLVLMDCQMPELDGWEATRQIRADERPGQRLYIVALTAGAFEGDRERSLASGMDEYLTKPFQIADLKRLLDRRG